MVILWVKGEVGIMLQCVILRTFCSVARAEKEGGGGFYLLVFF